jgi:DNA-binding HxlR family transcriptional regulator
MKKRNPYDQWAPDSRALDIAGDKWTLLIVRDLAAGPRRFVALERGLPGISTEQLRVRLAQMVADGIVTRVRYREAPPRVEYSLTPRGRDLMQVVHALAGWGARWTWSPPRRGEYVDAGALIRLAAESPVPAGLEGEIAAVVSGGRGAGADQVYLLEARAGRLSVTAAERVDGRPAMSGDQRAWVRALGPSGDHSRLSIDGDSRFAGELLDALRHSREHD